MTTPIKHVVIICKENHTFDNYFGQYPGANGIQLPPAPNPPLSDMNHTHYGWENRNTQGIANMMQYGQADIPGYWDLANKYTLCDNYFSEVAGPSTPNHLMLICAAAPIINNPANMGNPTPQTAYQIPSLPRRLMDNNISWGNYGGSPYPFGWIAGLPLANNHTPSAFAKDAAAGNLPAVSWVYNDNYSEHPPQNVTTGMAYTMQQIEAIASGPLWNSTMIFITWDDWGGWYDHVVPPSVEDWDPSWAQHHSDEYKSYLGDQYRYGSRVPCLVVGPYAKPGYISHQLNSHVSIPGYVETLFGLAPLTGRDDASSAMGDCYNYSQTPNPPYQGSY